MDGLNGQLETAVLQAVSPYWGVYFDQKFSPLCSALGQVLNDRAPDRTESGDAAARRAVDDDPLLDVIGDLGARGGSGALLQDGLPGSEVSCWRPGAPGDARLSNRMRSYSPPRALKLVAQCHIFTFQGLAVPMLLSHWNAHRNRKSNAPIYLSIYY